MPNSAAGTTAWPIVTTKALTGSASTMPAKLAATPVPMPQIKGFEAMRRPATTSVRPSEAPSRLNSSIASMPLVSSTGPWKPTIENTVGMAVSP